MNVYDVATKLIGSIEPVGETYTDNERYANLKEMCNMVDLLVSDIEAIAMNKGRYEYSMKRAGIYADQFLKRLREQEDDNG